MLRYLAAVLLAPVMLWLIATAVFPVAGAGGLVIDRCRGMRTGSGREACASTARPQNPALIASNGQFSAWPAPGRSVVLAHHQTRGLK